MDYCPWNYLLKDMIINKTVLRPIDKPLTFNCIYNRDQASEEGEVGEGV
jgi:hypothetical protein